MQTAAGTERLYGLDWLRIGAFALLILYHIGMFFVPWEWHVKTSRPLEWLELPMLAINPWRLALLFVVSGIASRVLLAKMARPGGFARSRSFRLLIPLLAGMVIFVVPQAWAELRSRGSYSGGLWTFWVEEYFRFGQIDGVDLPTWNHLWFVAYLWVYTMVLAGLAATPPQFRARLQSGFDRVFGGWRLLVLPALLFFAARQFVLPYFEETHALVNDPYAHLVYGFAFFFGVGLARSKAVWDATIRQWKMALMAGFCAYASIVALDVTMAGESGDFELLLRRVARSVQAWALIVGLIGFARLHLNQDGRVRRYLTEAIFPYYIAHQTIIVLVGFGISGYGLGAGAEFAIIFTATVGGCGLFFEVGRRFAWLRPFIGLKPQTTMKAAEFPAPASA